MKLTASQIDLARELLDASCEGRLADARDLCAQGARADVFFHNAHALFYAVEQEHVEMAKALLPHANPLLSDEDGATPLMLACRLGCVEMVELLLPPSDPWAVDGSGHAALAWMIDYAQDAPHVGQDPQARDARAAIFRLFAHADPALLWAQTPHARGFMAYELAQAISEFESQALAGCARGAAQAAPARRM